MRDIAQKNDQLRKQRFQRNWRLQDVADKLGTTVTTVQRWERGSQQPSAYYRAKLCELFGLTLQELGLEEVLPLSLPDNRTEAEVSKVVTSNEVMIWTVPYARNPHFTGRNDLLSQLEQQLVSPGTGQTDTIHQVALTQAQAVTGLGGIGKTQIAVEYAYRALAQERYTHTIWITAASEEAILNSFKVLAGQVMPIDSSREETDQHKLAAAVIHWLESCQQPWLLIFDNADDPSFIPSYLPRRGKGSILLTTRTSAVGSFASSIEVETMGLLEGIQLLLRRAQHFATASDEEIDDAGNLVVVLAQFPLALDQAGAYIEETGCSVRDYLALYRQHHHILLARRGMQVTGHPDSVATTWSLSFKRVEQVNPAAAELVRLCAFLSPDHIPEELLTEGASYWPSALRAAVANPLHFNQMIEDLLNFSLVKRLAEDHLLSLHRLVQVVQRERMQLAEQRQWAERVVLAVNTIFPDDPTNPVATWSRCQRYLEQVQICDILIQEHDLLRPEAAELLDRAGTYLRECALYDLAEPLYQRALHIWEQLLGPEHFRAAQTLNNLAILFWQQGKYEGVEALFLQALHIREQQVGYEHVDTAEIMNDLATFYTTRGRYKEAESLFHSALSIRVRQMGAEHLATAETLNNLANLYYNQGKYEQAESLFLRVLHIERPVEAAYPGIAYTLNNLANLYQKQGKYEQAEPLHQEALTIREQILGPAHPDVSQSLNNLAFLYYEQGKEKQAEPLYQQALHIREHQLGVDHPSVSYPLQGLALIYARQGKNVQAEQLYQKVLHIREQHLGADHSETAIVLHNFAVFKQAQGNIAEAIMMYQRALTIRERVLGVDHPITVKTRESLLEIEI